MWLRCGAAVLIALAVGVSGAASATGGGGESTSPRVSFAAGPWRLAAPPLRLSQFLSPDRKLWCAIGDGPRGEAWCGSMTPRRRVTLKRNGVVTICRRTTLDDCLQNWNPAAPVLGYGRRTENRSFRCTSAPNGITCTVIAAVGARGRGFRISATAVTRIAP